MYLGIFQNRPGKVLLTPAKKFDRVSAMVSNQLAAQYGLIRVTQAFGIMQYIPSSRCFLILKDRLGDGTSVAAAKYYGIDIDAEGYFRSNSDEVLFLLKYSGIQSEIAVDFPLI
jgi:hypothetical protein